MDPATIDSGQYICWINCELILKCELVSQESVGEEWKGNMKFFTCQLMKSVPDRFSCILSTFVDPLCLEENGPPFSMKSKLIDTTREIVLTRSWNKFDSVPWDHRGPRNPTDHFSSDSEDLSHHPHLLAIPLSGFPDPSTTSWTRVTISVGVDNSSLGPYA